MQVFGHVLFRFSIVESIPQNLTYTPDEVVHPPTYSALKTLLGLATKSVHIASFYWTLRGSDIPFHDNSSEPVSAIVNLKGSRYNHLHVFHFLFHCLFALSVPLLHCICLSLFLSVSLLVLHNHCLLVCLCLFLFHFMLPVVCICYFCMIQQGIIVMVM